MKHNNRIIHSIVIALTLLFTLGTASAQDVAGRIAFGFDAGGNKYYGNFTDSHFGFSGDVFIRWNILDWLSLHAAYNGGLLRYNSSTIDPPLSPGINTTRHGGWELAGSFNVFPDQTFVPYFMLGIEALNFEPKDVGNNPLPNNAIAAYSKNVMGGILGLGFEMFINDKVTFNGKVLLHLTGTDWLDDYSDPKNFRQDAFLTFGLGFAYYIFAPPLPMKVDNDHNNSTSNTTNITNVYNTNIIKGDTVYVAGPTDTIYLRRPKVNTIYNFPGTLFIVNSDQFNNDEPNNMSNLYNIKSLVNQCPDLKVEIQGHASDEGTVDRNQELSEMRAKRIQTWLIAQGVNPDHIAAAVGYGTSDNAVPEPKDASAADLEAARVQNRRIAVKVVQTCR